MPDLVVDWGTDSRPSIADLVAAGVKAIMIYTRGSTPPRKYLEDVIAHGIGVCPIFETLGERANEGFDAGFADGGAAAWDLDHNIGDVPPGVRLFVNMGDTPTSVGFEAAIRGYTRGFAETFPTKWRLGAYGNLAALRAAQQGSARFDKLWAVETWYPHSSGVPRVNFEFWQGQSDVVLVQMANILPPTISNTDDDWLIPGASLEAWGGGGEHPRAKTIVEDDEMIVAIPDDSKQCTFLGTRAFLCGVRRRDRARALRRSQPVRPAQGARR